MLNLEQCKEICTSGWPSNQREQARFDAEQWLIQEVERLTIESDGNINEGFNMASDYLSRSHTDQADEIASLNQQLEEANKETEGRRHDLAEFARITSQTVSDLKQQLSAAQATNAKLREALGKIAEQTPEKPDYWSSCSQCERNTSNAEDVLATIGE